MFFAKQTWGVTLSLTLITVYFLGTGCSAVEVSNDSPPEVQFAEGERLLKKDRFIESVERFRILKSRFPYSKYAALATLRIGDAHFQEEAFLEAASAYKIFRELYPKHEQTPYAIFRMGESHYNTLPSTIDRDLDPAQSALEAYNQLLNEFPNSAHQKDAENRVRELRGQLAEKESYVGDYYFKRELYEAAASRYSYLLLNFPEFGKSEENLYKLAVSFEKIGEFQKAQRAVEILNADFPNGARSKMTEELRKKIATHMEKESR